MLVAIWRSGRRVRLPRLEPVPASLALLIRQIDSPKRVKAHAVWPERAFDRDALADLINMAVATIQTLVTDDAQNGPSSYSSAVKFMGGNFPRVSPYQMTAVTS